MLPARGLADDLRSRVGELQAREAETHLEHLAIARKTVTVLADQLRADLRIGGWHDENQLEDFLTHLGEGGATAVLFRRTVCGTHLAYTGAS
ncbi:hypothetical protein ACFYMO_06295 [Streptomyces sp. NPDC007025]|uniref:hypothetical protein n=1 Tax=Streptomyces sp. NPDC007025 TaxID=3364771 RepID=UPI003680B827